VEDFKHLGNVIYDARCTREIKDRIAMAKVAFNRKELIFTKKTGLEFKEESSAVLRSEYSIAWC
jgi:hypothetical protein